MSSASDQDYYVPHGTHWPIIGSVGLTLSVVGFANYLHDTWSLTPTLVGLAILFFMMFGWFGQVISESESGTYNKAVDVSFRWGMGWFILSEVAFFAAFFGALFYARNMSVPWLGGESNNFFTNFLLW
nr:cytochrome c oxidase subunit 3 [Rhodobacter sp.]